MNESLPSHRLKFDRAVEHLYALQGACERWVQRDPCVVIEDCEIETRKHRAFVQVTLPPDDPLIPLRLADCIHNMRQALDHLAYALAISISRSDPPPNERDAAFPITTSKAKFESALYSGIAPKKKLPPRLYSDLLAIQPHEGRPQFLWLLHELDNIAKHRFLPVVAGVALGHSFDIGTFTGPFLQGPRLGLLEPDTPVIEYIPTPDTQVEMQLHFAGAVALDKATPIAAGEFILPMLSQIRAFILDEVFAPIEDFL